MHQLAIALHHKGYAVTGSDDEIFEPASSNLQAVNLLPPQTGWFPEKIHAGLDAVILGMHAKQDNPELIRARAMGLKIYSFPEYIYQESLDKIRVVVGGSHGKTTTTSMIMHVLQQTGQPFDYLVGAKLEGFPQSVKITGAPVIVCEGDEYPASALEKRPKFHFLFPHIAILTGIAWDHINVFPTFEFYLEQFRIFIDKIQPGGVLIFNQGDPVLKALVESHPSGVRKIGYDIPAHSIENGRTVVELEGLRSTLSVFGNHNLLNLQAAYLACRELKVDTASFLEAIRSFKGASKRLELLRSNGSTHVYRDFAHAPSKVKATIEAVREQFPGRKLIAVLELHTYSSLSEGFMQQYRGAMDKADQAVVFYSSHALSLKGMPALGEDRVAAGFGRPGLLIFTQREELKKWLGQQSYENANLLLMSSGNYDGMDLIALAGLITSA